MVADGFYEWKGERGHKQPYRVTRSDESVFAMASIWSQWTSPEGWESRESVAIVTTEPNDVMREIYDRMPVLLEPGEHETWLSGDVLNAHLYLIRIRPRR